MSIGEIAQLPWSLWRRQIAAVLRLELKKSFLSRRGLWIYLLAMGPLLLTAGHSLHVMSTGRQFCSIAEDSMAFATIFQLFYLKFGIFFGCVAVFTNLFRGEVLERTLHYYFLAQFTCSSWLDREETWAWS